MGGLLSFVREGREMRKRNGKGKESRYKMLFFASFASFASFQDMTLHTGDRA